MSSALWLTIGACLRKCPFLGTPRLPKHMQLLPLKIFAEERCRFIRDADDLVRCLPIKLEIELRSRLAVLPMGEMLELVAPQWPPRKRSAFDGNGHARRLPGD